MKAITTIGKAGYKAANLKRRKKRTSKRSPQELLDPALITHARLDNGGDFRSFSCRRFLGRGLTQFFNPLYVFKKPMCVYTHRKYWHGKVRRLWLQGKACMVLGSCPISPE
jgi:hypothetical protein